MIAKVTEAREGLGLPWERTGPLQWVRADGAEVYKDVSRIGRTWRSKYGPRSVTYIRAEDAMKATDNAWPEWTPDRPFGSKVEEPEVRRFQWEPGSNGTFTRADGVCVHEYGAGVWGADRLLRAGLATAADLKKFATAGEAMLYVDKTYPVKEEPEPGPEGTRMATAEELAQLARTVAEQTFGPIDSYPDDNPKTLFGLQKCPLHLVPTEGIEQEAHVFQHGAEKYGAYNWREKRVSASIYYAAALRHLFAWYNGEETDPDSGHPHLAHVRACMNIVLDAAVRGKLNDDRPGVPDGQ